MRVPDDSLVLLIFARHCDDLFVDNIPTVYVCGALQGRVNEHIVPVKNMLCIWLQL